MSGKKYSLLMYIAFVLISVLNVSAKSNPVCPPLTIFSDVSESGIETEIIQIPRSPVVAVRIYIRGGVFGEKDKRGSGLAAAVTKNISNNIKLPEDKFLCSKINADTLYDAACFSTVTLKENLPETLNILGKAICNENFKNSNWKITRDELMEEILQNKKEPWYQHDSLLKRTIYMWNPVRTPVLGNLSLFSELNRTDLINFYRKYFVADNLIIVIAGDVNPREVSYLINRSFTSLPRKTGVLPEKYEEPLQTSPRWLERHGNVTQSYVSVSFATADAGHSDNASLDILTSIVKKETSTIENELKKSIGEINNLKIFNQQFPGCPEMFVVSFACSPEKAARGARIVANRLLKLSTRKWDTNKIKREKLRVITGFLSKMNSPDYAAKQVGISTLRLGNPHYPTLKANQSFDVTPDSLNKICEKYFTSDRMSTVILSPKENTKELNSLHMEKILRGERALLGNIHQPVKRVTLDNGVVLLLRRDSDCATVNFAFGTIGGIWCENENNNGVFSVLGKIMNMQTGKKQKQSFFNKEEKNEIGLFPSAKATEQTFILSAVALPEFAQESAKELCRIWTNAEITEKNVAEAVTAVINNLDSQATNISELADIVFRASVFQKQPYRFNILGTPQALSSISPKDVSEIYNDFISPLGTVILVSGDFDEAAMEKEIKNAVGNFKKKKKSNNFIKYSDNYKLKSLPPYLSVELPEENKITNNITHIFTSGNQDTIVICGINAPGFNSTNFPFNITKIIKSALMNQLEKLSLEWVDFENKKIVKYFDAVEYQGYDSGWIYTTLILPNEKASLGANRLRTVFYNTLNGLANGSLISAATGRAEYDYELSLSDNNKMLQRIIISELFGLSDSSTLISSPGEYSINKFQLFMDQYGKYPVTTIIAPGK